MQVVAPDPADPHRDVLSQVLDAFRLRGSMSARLAVRTPWGYAIPASRHLGLLVVMRGRVRFESAASSTGALEIASGDVVAISQGDPFAIRDAAGSALTPIEDSGTCDGSPLEQAGAQTELLLLHCELSGGCTNPVRAALPRLIHCAGDDGRVARWLEPSVRLLALESSSRSLGRSTVLNRLAEVVFVHLIRAWLDSQPPECGGWFRVMTDPPLARALAAFHTEPGGAWTLRALAAQAGLSRSAFASRFRSLAGETPLEYVTRWRIEQAKSLIETDGAPFKQIVGRLGYASEAAFRTAFKRQVGETPGAYRAKRRATALASR
jgi:AraC-like DNA-binding protein